MGNIHLVTGYAGQEHVTAADQGAFNAAFFGGEQFIFAKGNQFSASIVTNNQVRVLDGDIYMQGRYIRLNKDSYVDLAIENGEQAVFRNDLIVVRYTKDAGTGVEDANLVVIKGTAAANDPVDPAHTAGDLIENNDILNDIPLYRVVLNGINIQELVPLFTVKDTTVPKATTATYTATVTDAWTADGDYFYQDIEVTGILATDNPVVDINPGTDNAANVLYGGSICKVFRITTSADSIRVWATAAVTTAFPIQLKVVR